MPSDEPEKRSGHSKRRRRSLSLSMASSFKVIDLTDSKPEDSGSRKHGLHENDCQAEGPSKRVKPNRGSEPPMRKDTRMTPEAKRKKLSKVNHCKASRTSNHRELKDKTRALERELENARQAHDDTKRDIQADLEWHAQELKRLQQHCDEKADNARKQEQMVVTAHRDNEKLERKLEDAANVVKALQISCQDKDRELNARAGDIAALQKELDDSDHRSKALKESLGVTNLKLNGKDDIIAALKKEIDGFKRHSGSLEKALAEMKAALKSKDELVAAKQKELDKSEHQSATLKESLGEQERALTASKRDKSDCLKQLASTNEKLSSKELELDQAKTAHDKAREEAEALHLINEAHGHRIQDVRARGQRVKKEYKNNASKLEAEKAELQTQCTELQARLEIQEDKQNQMVTNLHLKLKEARQQSQRHNYKEPDEKIRADFSNLESKIRQFVDKRARPVLNATDRELKTAWPNWSPQLRSFLAAPLLCNMVLEAYVWERLVARIFTPESKVWVGEVGKSMDKALCLAAGNYDLVVLKYIEVPCPQANLKIEETALAGYKSDLYIDFQYLRSFSSCLINRLNGADFRPNYFESDVEAMTSTLAKLCGLHEVNDEMKADAMGIFKDARDFEIQLRMLKATYTLRMCQPVPGGRLTYGFSFANDNMHDRSPKPNHKSPEQAPEVDFIMCPGLHKRGNNSGANYEAKTCLIKMGVICNAEEYFRKSGASNSSRSTSEQARKALNSGETKQETEGHVTGSTARGSKRGSSISDPVHIKGEGTGTHQGIDPLSTPGLISGPPAPKSRGAAQMQSSTPANMMTRSQASPKSDSNIRDGKSNTKSKSNNPHPMGAARGGGGISSTKRTRPGRGSDPDADYHPQSSL